MSEDGEIDVRPARMPRPVSPGAELSEDEEDSYSSNDEGSLTDASDDDWDIGISEKPKGSSDRPPPQNKKNVPAVERDKRDPQYIPRTGRFYLHDDRDDPEENGAEATNEETTGGLSAKKKESEKEGSKDKRPGTAIASTKKSKIDSDRWEHDLFDPNSRALTDEEIIAKYGYNIRLDKRAPKASKHYGRSSKYDRDWKDEAAYHKGRGGSFAYQRGGGGRRMAAYRGVGSGGSGQGRERGRGRRHVSQENDEPRQVVKDNTPKPPRAMRRKETENNEKIQHRPVQQTTPQLKPSKPSGEVKAENPPRMPDQEVQKSEKEEPIVPSQTYVRRLEPLEREIKVKPPKLVSTPKEVSASPPIRPIHQASPSTSPVTIFTTSAATADWNRGEVEPLTSTSVVPYPSPRHDFRRYGAPVSSTSVESSSGTGDRSKRYSTQRPGVIPSRINPEVSGAAPATFPPPPSALPTKPTPDRPAPATAPGYYYEPSIAFEGAATAETDYASQDLAFQPNAPPGIRSIHPPGPPPPAPPIFPTPPPIPPTYSNPAASAPPPAPYMAAPPPPVESIRPPTGYAPTAFPPAPAYTTYPLPVTVPTPQPVPPEYYHQGNVTTYYPPHGQYQGSRTAPPRRPNAAIPIVPPPSSEKTPPVEAVDPPSSPPEEAVPVDSPPDEGLNETTYVDAESPTARLNVTGHSDEEEEFEDAEEGDAKIHLDPVIVVHGEDPDAARVIIPTRDEETVAIEIRTPMRKEETESPASSDPVQAPVVVAEVLVAPTEEVDVCGESQTAALNEPCPSVKEEASKPLPAEGTAIDFLQELEALTVSPHEKEQGTPAEQKQETIAEQKKDPPAEQKREALAEQKQEKETPAEQKQETPAEQKQEKPAEQKQETPAEQKQETPAEQKQETPAEQKQETPTAPIEEAQDSNKASVPLKATSGESEKKRVTSGGGFFSSMKQRFLN